MRGHIFETLVEALQEKFPKQELLSRIKLTDNFKMEAERRGLMHQRKPHPEEVKYSSAWHASKPLNKIFLNDRNGVFQVWSKGNVYIFVTDAADACECLIMGETWLVSYRMAKNLGQELER